MLATLEILSSNFKLVFKNLCKWPDFVNFSKIYGETLTVSIWLRDLTSITSFYRDPTNVLITS